MKKTNNIYFILLLAGSLAMGSCKKSFLEQKPADTLSPDQALSNETVLVDNLNGAYAGLRAVALYGRDFPIIGDLMADNTYVEKDNTGRYLIQYNYTMASSDGVATEMWATGYTAIGRVNRIIDANVTGTTVAATKAEALAIRALVYFKLVNIFAKPYTDDPNALGIPLVLHYDPYALPTRNKISDI